MQIITRSKVHPVVVIGSGASGGMAAWNLTQKGIDVLLLDAGGRFDRSKFWTHTQPWEAHERNARGERPPQFYLDTKEQPYITPDGRPFQLDARVGTRRKDERVGARQPSLLGNGFQGRGAGWLGNPMADLPTRTSRRTTIASNN